YLRLTQHLPSFPTRRSSDLNPGISNFAGIAGPPNLTEAYFGNSSLNSLGFLPNLSQLTFLSFESNPVTNFSSLAALPKLKGLDRSEEHTSELQSQSNLVCRL